MGIPTQFDQGGAVPKVPSFGQALGATIGGYISKLPSAISDVGGTINSIVKKNPNPIVQPNSNDVQNALIHQVSGAGAKPTTSPGIINNPPKTQVLGDITGGQSDHQATVGLLNSQLDALQKSLRNAQSQGVSANDNTTQLDSSGNRVTPQNPTTLPINGSTTGAKTTNGMVNTPANTSTTPSATTISPTFPGIISGLVSKSSQPSADYTETKKNADQYNEALKTSRINEAQGLASNAGNPIPLEFQQGRGQILQNQYTQEQNALGQAYNAATAQQGAANTQQGLQQTGLTSAAGFAQPVGQFGMLTNPQTGEPLNTQVFQSAIQQAQQLVNSGTPVNDPSVQSLLSPFGFVGPLAFNQAMQAQQGSGWNPAAQSAATSQNISQGTQSQGQAYDLNLGLQQLKTVKPMITNFLSASGINSTDSPLYNQPINTYIQKLGNPAAMTQYAYMINDLQKFASQMLAAGGGGTPTGVQAATQLMDPSMLSMKQIQSALDTLDTLGTNQVSVLQSQASASLGGNRGQYAGNPATTSTSTPVAAPSTSPGSGITNPVTQGAIGGGINAWSELYGIAKAFLSQLF